MRIRFSSLLNTDFLVFLFFVFAAGLAGCGDSGSPAGVIAPTAPSPVGSVPSPVTGGEWIKGTVSDSGLRPIAGARVELLDGPQAGLSAITDARGQFSLFGTVDDTTRFRASREGHVTAERTVMPNCDRCNPRRWVHFYLDVLDAPVAIAGDYTLTFIADSACTNLPAELRTRTYETTVALGDFGWWGFPPRAPTSFEVTPKGLAFPDGLNFFWLNVAGNFIAIVLGDHTDPGLTERVAEDTYFAYNGWAEVSVEAPVSTISARFQGWIDRCVNPNMGTRYDCTPGPAVTRTRCDSTNHQLILTRH